MRDDRTFARAMTALSSAMALVSLAACSTWNHSARHQPVVVEPTPVAETPQPNRIDPFPAARGVQFESSSSAIFPSAYANSGGNHFSPGSPQFYMYGEMPNMRASTLNQSSPFETTANVRQVSFSPEGADFDPVVSRDGTMIYYTSTQHAPTADIYVKSVKGSAI
ncbi:MAG: PD40 domain-containing protein, partial [Phycisphaerales bacterium]|nr:PD40 domain-containing protein [Phycisphaerales bacterium]